MALTRDIGVKPDPDAKMKMSSNGSGAGEGHKTRTDSQDDGGELFCMQLTYFLPSMTF